MFTKKQIIIFAIASVISVLVVFLLIPYLITNQNWGWAYTTNTGAIGDTIGGTVGPVVGFVGVILTFLAFYIQYQANQIQINSLREQAIATAKSDRINAVQQTESTFFELLRLHRENVSAMKYRGHEGVRVLVVILNQFYDVLNLINMRGKKWPRKLTQRDNINIAYLITFFGVHKSHEVTLNNALSFRYADILNEIGSSIAEIKEKKVDVDGENVTYVNGQQSRLGHYFRHLFMLVNFIHEDEILSVKEKKKYIKILRTQLATQEQTLFFFNSLSDLGQAWELDDKVLPEDKLITTYELIKNIPYGLVNGVKPKQYYPGIKFEGEA